MRSFEAEGASALSRVREMLTTTSKRLARYAEDLEGLEARRSKPAPEDLKDAAQVIKDLVTGLLADMKAAAVEVAPDPKAGRLLKRALALCEESGYAAKVYVKYSGNGMFGRYSSAALTTDCDPLDEIGARLLKMGFRVDNLGRGYVYYLTW